MAADNVVMQVPAQRFPAGLKPLLLLLGVAAAIAAGVYIVLWSQAPSYSLLFGNLAEADKAQVVQSLEQNQIPYKLEPGTGAVLVPVSYTHLTLPTKRIV